MQKKILICSLVFSPDGVSTAYLYNDIALGLQENGYNVVVLTTTPHYNIVKDELEKQPLRKCWGGLFYKSDFHGIPVYHIPQKKFKSFLARSTGFVYWHVLTLLLGFAQRNISLILSPSPPLTIGLISIILGKIKRVKTVYNVQEIYPDFLINQGSVKLGFFLNILRRMERFIYNHSDKVVTIDRIFYNTIVNRFKNPAKLAIIPNFVDDEIYKPIDNAPVLLDKQLFPNNDVLKVMYAGNIGHAQDWGQFLLVAEHLKDAAVEFWLIGEGAMKDELTKEVELRELKKVHLLPYQFRLQIPAMINFADIHFIFMSPQMEGQGFPSKVYTIMACKKPLLVVSGVDTPLYQFLKDKDCSFLIAGADIDEKSQKIDTLLRALITDGTRISAMGENALARVQEKYSKQVVVKQYVQLIDDLLNKEIHV